VGDFSDNCDYVPNSGQENSNVAENVVFTKTDYGAEEDCIST